MSTIAIDWSGAKNPNGKIWIAVCEHGQLLGLSPADSRTEAIGRLLDQLSEDSNAVGGLDFAFSMPAWFVDELGGRSGPDLWPIVQKHGERWLRECTPPFWGRPGKKKPSLPGHFRRTEELVEAVGGIKPKSVFQIGGAGAVGTGSVRGMPYLSRLRDSGVAIWPFEKAIRPLVVEIYPRLLTGPVVKSSSIGRIEYLDANCIGMKAEHRATAASSEDAFDAAVSALRLEESLTDASFPPGDMLSSIEGEIWPETGHLMGARS